MTRLVNAIKYAVPSLLLCKIVWGLLRQYRLSRILPPGPRGLPFLGNIFQVPKNTQWIPFTEWAEKYGEQPTRIVLVANSSHVQGPVFSLNLAGQTLVVLNKREDAVKLLGRQPS